MSTSDSLDKYYTSLVRQKPKSILAISWCIQNGYVKHAKKYGHPKVFNVIWQEMKARKEKKEKKEKKEMQVKKENNEKREKEGIKKLQKGMKEMMIDTKEKERR